MSPAPVWARAESPASRPSDIQEQSQYPVDDALEQALGGGLPLGAYNLVTAGAAGPAGRRTGLLDMGAGAGRLAPIGRQRRSRRVPVGLTQVGRQRAEAWRWGVRRHHRTRGHRA